MAMMERPDLVAAEMREFLHGIVRDEVAQPGWHAPLSQRPRAEGQPAEASSSQAGPSGSECLAGRSAGVR